MAAQIKLTINVDDTKLAGIEKRITALTSKPKTITLKLDTGTVYGDLGKINTRLGTTAKERSIKIKSTQVDAAAEKVEKLGAAVDSLSEKAPKIDAQNIISGINEVKKGVDSIDQKISKSVDNAKQKTDNLFRTIAKNARDYIIRQSVIAITNSFREALDTIKKVDSELATIQKVTDFSDSQMALIEKGAYSTASRYGVNATEYLESVGTFARAGYKANSEALGELAVKTQLVGDVTASTADQFLLAVDAAWKYNGSMAELSTVLDKANIIENNYATSIEKIAQGLPNVASVASMAGMSVDDTIAALGTITAVTQQSASKASTALRALILNILGDTNTAFENEYGEFVKWTEDETEVLRGLLNEYASDVVKAADATGTLINPMEAIRALGKAFDEGKLSAAQLEGTLQKIGGKLRTNQLVALVENYKTLDDMLVLMGNSAGSADKEIGIMLDTWEAKSNILKNTWTEFVSTSFSSDFFKGLLSGLTNIIKAIGDMPTLILGIAAAIAVVKLPTILTSITKVSGAIKAFFSLLATGVKEGGLKTLASNFKDLVGGANLGRIAIVALTAAYMAISKAIDAYYERLSKAVEASRAEAQSAKDNADKISDLYDTYLNAKSAYAENQDAVEQYTQAVYNLADALGVEKGALEDVEKAIRSKSIAEIDSALATNEAARADIHNQLYGTGFLGGELNKTSGRQLFRNVVAGSSTTVNPLALQAARANININTGNRDKDLQNIVKLWQWMEAEQKRLAAAGEEQSREYVDLVRVMSDYSAVIQPLLDTESEYNDLLDQRNSIIFGQARNKENVWTNSADEEIRTIDNIRAQYDGLTQAIKKAGDATSEFAENTKEELDSAYKEYSNIYQKFLSDWESGLHGSNVVLNAISTMFSEEQISEMFAKGMSIEDMGSLLASDFYQNIFSAKGEDQGALFAEWLISNEAISEIDERGRRVIKVGDEIALALEKDGDATKFIVEDFELFAEAMDNLGVPLSAEYLASWLQALGMYSADTEMTISTIKDMANALGAVNPNGILSLDKFVTSLKAGGKSNVEILQILEEINKAREKGEIDVAINLKEGQTESDRIEELLNLTSEEAAAANEAVIPVKVEDTEFQRKKREIDAAKREIAAPIKIKITADTDFSGIVSGITDVLNQVKARKQAIEGLNTLLGEKNIPQFKAAGGTASSGLALVNEQGAEIIWDGKTARIAGAGKPTITWLNYGDRVYTASQTSKMLGGISEEALYDGIGAYAGGQSSYISGSWQARSSSSSNSSSGGSSSSSSASTKDAEIERLENLVKYYESVRDVVEARGGGVKEQITAINNIRNALQNQINYMKSIGASQTEINKLTTQWYKLNDDIAKLQKEMFAELQDAIKNEIDKVNDKRDAEKDKIQEQIDALKEARDVEQDQLDLEEKILAVQEAEERLRNAQLERTVRMYNATTGQWEWVANSKNVQDATEELLKAQQALKEFQDNLEYEAAVKALENQKDAVDERYDKIVSDWEKISDSLDEPAKTISRVLFEIGANATASQAGQINSLNAMLAQFGYKITPKYDSGGILKGLGGIKATAADEMILPPNITKAMLSPSSNAMFQDRMRELAIMYGAQGYSMNRSSIGTQHNGGTFYTYGNITLTQAQAERTTVAEFARMARGLTSYNSAI